jgi:hypothetical protein
MVSVVCSLYHGCGFWVIGLWLKVLIVNKLLYSRLGVLYGQIYGVLLMANIETEFVIYDLLALATATAASPSRRNASKRVCSSSLRFVRASSSRWIVRADCEFARERFL